MQYTVIHMSSLYKYAKRELHQRPQSALPFGIDLTSTEKCEPPEIGLSCGRYVPGGFTRALSLLQVVRPLILGVKQVILV